jgi:hypothetical protein
MPRTRVRKGRRTRAARAAPAVGDAPTRLKLLITSVLAVFLAIDLIYASVLYSSLSTTYYALQSYANYLDNSFVSLQGSYMRLQAGYSMLNDSLSNVTVVNPPVRFYVGGSPANATGLTQVPKDQIFCPESAAIQKQAAELFSFPYYTELKPGEEFNYTVVFNQSGTGAAQVAVMAPFELVSYNSTVASAPACAGYPNALYEVTTTMRAPKSNYTGPVMALIYR